MICRNCGTENDEKNIICSNCGATLKTEDQPQQTQQQPYQQPYQQPVTNEDYTPISMWGYFGYELLFSIPCVGFIALIIFSFGGSKNVNVKNFARSYFCFLIIAVIFAAILIATGAFATFSSLMYQ